MDKIHCKEDGLFGSGQISKYVKQVHCNKFVVRSPLIFVRPRNLGSDLTDLMTKINVLSYSIERLPLTPPHHLLHILPPCLSHPPSPCLSHHPSFSRLAGLTKELSSEASWLLHKHHLCPPSLGMTMSGDVGVCGGGHMSCCSLCTTTWCGFNPSHNLLSPLSRPPSSFFFSSSSCSSLLLQCNIHSETNNFLATHVKQLCSNCARHSKACK